MSRVPVPQDRHGGLPDDLTPREVAELYAAGALTPADAAAFETRVRAGDAAFVQALAEVRPAMDRLLNHAEPVAPPAHVRATLMARLDADGAEADDPFAHEEHVHEEHESAAPAALAARSEGGAPSGVTILRAATGRWKRTGLPGVRYQTLLADRKANRRTILLDMAPGSALPDHSHAGIEEVYMLSGDLSIAGSVLGKGDYIRIERGARHGVPRTEGGCVCIVISDFVPFPMTSLIGFAWAAIRSLFVGGRKPKGR